MSLRPPTRSTTKCTGAACAQSISGKVTRNLCSKRSSKQRQGLKIFGVEFGHPIFFSWLFFFHKKMEPEFFVADFRCWKLQVLLLSLHKPMQNGSRYLTASDGEGIYGLLEILVYSPLGIPKCIICQVSVIVVMNVSMYHISNFERNHLFFR